MKITKIKFIKVLKEEKITLFEIPDIQRIFNIGKKETVYKSIQRLEGAGVVERVRKGKYYFVHTDQEVSDFTLANFLINPSYVSLESALSFYGLLDQFPHQITSVTPKKTRKMKVRNKTFSFSQIKPELFLGYEKKGNFLIATPEKAVVDIVYLSRRTKQRIPQNIQVLELDQERVASYEKKLGSKWCKEQLIKLGINFKIYD